jgi:hypothetical protein
MPTNSHLLDPSSAVDYIRHGHGKATIVGLKDRWTYQFATGPKDGPEKFRGIIFVRLLVAGDCWEYIGFLRDSGGQLMMTAGRKGNAAHPAFGALAWYLAKAQTAPAVAAKAEFWHQGTCCACGRDLRDPQSISLGIGPVCRGRDAPARPAALAA